MDEAAVFAQNLKLRLIEKYPGEWFIETGPSSDGKNIRVSLKHRESSVCQLEYPVEGFHVDKVFLDIWTKVPPFPRLVRPRQP